MGNQQCGACSRSTDMFLCWDCCRELRNRLETIAWLAGELDITLTRQDRIGTPGGRVSGSVDKPLPFHTAASEAAWVLRNTITTWVRELCESRAIDYVPLGFVDTLFVGPLRPGERYVPRGYVETTSGAARWLAHHATSIALSDCAAEAYDEITDAMRAAMRVIDRPPGRMFVGPCGAPISNGECATDIYVSPGREHARCPDCGTTHSVTERREQLQQQVRGLLGTAAELARLLPWIMNAPITRKRITYYARRGMVSRREHRGETVFQIGEVIDAHIQCEERRAA
ncbi:hypothetical protein [Nocardia otitidiscaviarum]|uniref:hypothetical protein n=1 Tax=Nocardia otitidiscaviarum TaxID=1823 RepID=UPI0011DE415E|nr:hypothetical protein [Nocardia otitidiscaviarum]